MTPEFYDLEDLLDLIKELEARIIQLERLRERPLLDMPDGWYWNHG